MKFKVGDKVRFSQQTINRFINESDLDKTAKKFVFERKIHTVTRIDEAENVIWIDNIQSSMLGSWRTDLFPMDKIDVPQLDDDLFTL